MKLSNGREIKQINVMYKENELVAIIKKEDKATLTLENLVLDVLKNPLTNYKGSKEDISSLLTQFLERRRIALNRPNRDKYFPKWVKTTIDELYITGAKSIDDNTSFHFVLKEV